METVGSLDQPVGLGLALHGYPVNHMSLSEDSGGLYSFY